MIKLGICTALENARILAALGYDYIELSLAATAALSEPAFGSLRESLQDCRLPCGAMNCMMPADLPVVGSHVDWKSVRNYLAHALDRAQALGAETVVFGSGASRMVPEGFPGDQAICQLRDFLKLAGDAAAARGIRIAIEPLRWEECNILNYVAEAHVLAALTEHPGVGVLGDTYHMDSVGEPLAALARAGKLLWHVHTARPVSRCFPRDGDGAAGHYEELFQILKAAGYDGRVSIEGGTENFQRDAEAGFKLLDGLRR